MKLELLDFIELENYPSGSGIEFYDDKIYIVGEESKDLLVMGKKWNKPTLIGLFDTTDKKNPLPAKSDLESMTVLSVKKKAPPADYKFRLSQYWKQGTAAKS